MRFKPNTTPNGCGEFVSCSLSSFRDVDLQAPAALRPTDRVPPAVQFNRCPVNISQIRFNVSSERHTVSPQELGLSEAVAPVLLFEAIRVSKEAEMRHLTDGKLFPTILELCINAQIYDSTHIQESSRSDIVPD
ncbi:unnamed protein product [Pleuronectes platessa]|uniref:Uncharacterized protein n=1 Tax=Pleuronectes platessa TaxID=8262 RepID=A0A9N7ZC11_PLEPL|nr:unnamed protein product [Pleuronectes platessa]